MSSVHLGAYVQICDPSVIIARIYGIVHTFMEQRQPLPFNGMASHNFALSHLQCPGLMPPTYSQCTSFLFDSATDQTLG
jgi:hypothetical protein